MQEAMNAFVRDAALAVTLGQRLSVEMTLGYLLALSRLELGNALELQPSREGNAGFTADGRDIADALGAVRARFFKNLNEGKPLEAATTSVALAAARTAAFEVMDASTLEMEHQLGELDVVRGWRSRSRGTCGACLARDDGAVRGFKSAKTRPPYHPGCHCIAEPAFDVEDKVERRTGRQRFEALSEEEQDAALGADKAKLLRGGLVSWDHLIAVNTFKEWTPVLTEASLTDLLAVAGITKEALQEIA